MSHHEHAHHTAGPEARDIGGLPLLLPVGLGVGLVALALAAVVAGGDWKLFGMGYLTAYACFLTVSIGALFFVIIHHLTRAGWSVTVRRIAEVMALNCVTLFLLAVPILLLSGEIYHWAHPHGDVILEAKAVWLNVPFWSLRLCLYLAVWSGMAWWLWNNSLKQDRAVGAATTEKSQNWAGLLTVLFALSTYYGITDLLMTLDPHWYSTMFAVNVFGGAFLNFCATTILLVRFLQWKGLVRNSITTEHYHDLGKFMFAFIFFWGYTAYSQWMLIWYANIPEETAWFAKRGVTTSELWGAGVWAPFGPILLLGHLFIPFAGLLSRGSKRRLPVLTFWAAWMTVMHFVDMFWIVMPEYKPGNVENPGMGLMLLVSGLCWVGVGGVWLGGFAYLARRGSLVPLNDPRQHEALAYEVY